MEERSHPPERAGQPARRLLLTGILTWLTTVASEVMAAAEPVVAAGRAAAAVAAAGADGVAVVTAAAVSSHTDHAEEVESCKTTCYICRVKMYTSMKNK